MAPETGRFHYVESWHDPYQKRVLAVEFGPNRAPMADGDQVLDLLANHPGTAVFICRKLIHRLLADDPDPAMVDRVAAVFLNAADAPDQIAQVIRAIVADPLFASTPPHKLRRPFEYLAAIYRATGAAMVIPENGFSLAMTTDYRAVLAELLTHHMKTPDLAAIFPDFTAEPPGLWR